MPKIPKDRGDSAPHEKSKSIIIFLSCVKLNIIL